MPIQKTVAIIGGGPSGLFAAEYLSRQGFTVSVYDRKPSVGRKFLMAGRGGLNLTHSEDIKGFISRYGAAAPLLEPAIRAFPPESLRMWCEGLGQKTFVGSSGRVFPESFKASPLLRAWIARLEAQGVQFCMEHDWQGWEGEALVFHVGGADERIHADAVLLAMGGASWPRLGSDGSWMDNLQKRGVSVSAFQPANCGFVINWSEHFRERFSGQPLKSIALKIDGGEIHSEMMGEIMIDKKGIEGGAVYALSRFIRDEVNHNGTCGIEIDLKPDFSFEQIAQRLKAPRGKLSFSNFVRKVLNISPLAVSLLLEGATPDTVRSLTPENLALRIKSMPLTALAPFPIERAISSAGGIRFDSMSEDYMIRALPGVFAAGEMLDWEAPTGGYLLQGCFATGLAAAKGIERFLTKT